MSVQEFLFATLNSKVSGSRYFNLDFLQFFALQAQYATLCFATISWLYLIVLMRVKPSQLDFQRGPSAPWRPCTPSLWASRSAGSKSFWKNVVGFQLPPLFSGPLFVSSALTFFPVSGLAEWFHLRMIVPLLLTMFHSLVFFWT